MMYIDTYLELKAGLCSMTCSAATSVINIYRVCTGTSGMYESCMNK